MDDSFQMAAALITVMSLAFAAMAACAIYAWSMQRWLSAKRIVFVVGGGISVLWGLALFQLTEFFIAGLLAGIILFWAIALIGCFSRIIKAGDAGGSWKALAMSCVALLVLISLPCFLAASLDRHRGDDAPIVISTDLNDPTYPTMVELPGSTVMNRAAAAGAVAGAAAEAAVSAIKP